MYHQESGGVGRYFVIPIAVLLVFLLQIHAAPPINRQKAGPCIGMDCLHGILMHGDSHLGDDHKHDDDEAAKKEKERLQAEAGRLNVKVPMEELHGVLMHGDNKMGDDHQHDHETKERLRNIESMVKHDFSVDDAHRNAFGEDENKGPRPPPVHKDGEEEDDEGHGEPKKESSWMGRVWTKIAALVTGRTWSVGETQSRIAAQQETVAIHDIMEDLRDVGRADKARSHVHHRRTTKQSQGQQDAPPHTEH